MANSDYTQSGVGNFASLVILDAPVGRDTTVLTFTEFRFARAEGIVAGMAAMIDDEFVRVESVEPRSITVKRGCADTIPAGHAAGAHCWIITGAVGTDRKEHGAGETVGVKVAPFTLGGGALPIASVAPDAVTFDWRFFRPYPPGQMKVNNARWYEPATVSEGQPSLALSWVHRDRVLQADQLIGHDDGSVGPEPGTTYTLRVHKPDGTIVRTEPGLAGQAFLYQWPQVMHDFGYPSVPTNGYLTFCSNRDNLDSQQKYITEFTLDPAGTLTSQYMAFDQRMTESPYSENLRRTKPGSDDFAIGMASRPSDRMADVYDLVHYWTEYVDTGEKDENNDPIFELVEHTDVLDANRPFTPWVISDFKLPELETTLNVRSTSLADGVSVPLTAVDQIALIGDEMVRIQAFGDGTITLLRGVGDTVPQVHLAGAKMWLFQSGACFDPFERNDGSQVPYRLRPKVYGPPVYAPTLPVQPVIFDRRSDRPYAPGQIVVNGRPWFEEAQATTGNPVIFTWARRNRVAVGDYPTSHGEPDELPEVGQVTRLTFFYETPPAGPGQPPTEHVLRSVDVGGTGYAYPYALAQADGDAAGRATGVCGTVVISVRIDSTRDGLASWQRYTVPLRLPSYPCTP